MDFDAITSRVFAKLGEEKQLQRYQEIAYNMLGVVIDFINADGETLRLSRGRCFNSFCTRLRATAEGRRRCDLCDRENARVAAATHRPRLYGCHAGLAEILVPLYGDNGRYIGSMTSGQFLRYDSTLRPEVLAETAAACKIPVSELAALYRRSITLSEVQIKGLMEFLLLIGQQLVSTHENLLFMETVHAPDKITEIRDFVAANYRKPLKMGKVARQFFLSPGYFSHFFRRKVGVNFNAYVTIYRVTKAKELLSGSETPISEIAELTGFGSLSQFNRVFRHVAGMSPGQFRNAEAAASKPGDQL